MPDLTDAFAITMMWSQDLEIMHRLASQAPGPIIEIGPYIGGSTVCLARGMRSDQRLITIECGGAYLDHPRIPNSDIISDLQANLRRLEVRDRVDVVEGYSHSPGVIDRVGVMLRGQRAGLLFIDADGEIARDLRGYAPFLSERCLLAFDDYNVDNEKANVVRSGVDQAVAVGAIVPISADNPVWFGCVNGEQGLRRLRQL